MAALGAHSHGFLRRFSPRPLARARLVCFPHAGGAASTFAQWHRWIPADIEVAAIQYAGRHDRLDEAPATRMAELVAPVVAELSCAEERADVPLALFGHSMGASVAFEVAAALESLGRAPAALFVSAQFPPRLLAAENAVIEGDAALLGELRRLGGAEAELFDSPELLEIVMPAVRADFRLIGGYRPDPGARVGVPVVAYTGDRDPYVHPEQVRHWTEATTGPVEVRVWPGDHFYLVPRRAEVLADLAGRLDRLLAAAPR
ncbi:thioesterase II family protein [Allonocardiopsis opalescens]|uniref:Pyochelin biosynthetic protein PchC n=1 Tax=Allonocardiopsis opalescens TaxID=1144618 RepID=A0A2T0PY85_9ACTN|nr:alpha/beta fold hydrolase [Allonocardiopsis opalescens]PRX96501.1 pyochelin biosynthetic protein PchC [Allonocardiopsis opalescens]